MQYPNQLIFLLCLVVLLFSCGESNENAVRQPVRPVKAIEVTLDDGQDLRTFTGVAQASAQTPLSFRVGGNIRQLTVKLGDRVSRGQTLARLDATDLQVQASQASAQRSSSEAQLESAKTQLVNARGTYERSERLYETSAISLSEFENALAQYEAARAQVDAAESQLRASSAQVDAAGNQVNYTRLVAPFSGIVLSVEAEENQLVGAGAPIVLLAKEADPEVAINLPENLISAVKRGMEVEVSFPVLDNQSFQGEVSEVAFAAGAAPSYPVLITIADRARAIRPGMAANVAIPTASGGKLAGQPVVPPAAVGEDTEGRFVFLLEPTGQSDYYQARRRAVTVGDLVDEGFRIDSGLEVGDLVVTAGLKQLLDGMEVRLLAE